MNPETKILLQLLLVIVLCGVIGLEREVKKRGAGLQTYSLVGLGSALFVILTLSLMKIGQGFVDPSHAIQAIATGIGFIGAGVVFRGEGRVEGLTTAVGIWVAAAIGVAVALELYAVAIVSTFLALFILVFFGGIEKKYMNK
jgi:putative Mg2+ transporter-C (MgtC) family protein